MSADIEDDAVSGVGIVYSSTVVRSGPKDRKLPYGLAHVDLEVGLRVLAAYDVEDDRSIQPESAVVVAEVGRSDAGLPLIKIVRRVRTAVGDTETVAAL
ncbi:OB-fold domain-containing protein [Nocardia sp. NPDC050713]|uniref:OB-fold domain-containing protein n=1 Tax=Nocardia TaxID=1817 RepID=UPI00082C32AF|nr:OB-fold domain-containing protein [Nocardia xishanensis]